MLPLREVVFCDFEFVAIPGERPAPVCAVAHELRSGRCFRLWKDQLGSAPPWCVGPDVLFVAYYASAELGCYRVLNWPMPERVIDLFAEFRCMTNGLATPAGASLLGALAFYGLDPVGSAEKNQMQQEIGGGTWEARYNREDVLNYCEGDVRALQRLFAAMWPKIDLPRALVRGRYMAAAAAVEFNGVPIDIATLDVLKNKWTNIQDRLIGEIDRDYQVYEGRTFKTDRFAKYLADRGIPWPVLESGNIALDDETFRHMSKAYPIVSPLRELRNAMSDLRLRDLTIGKDGRNRTILSAFRSRTSRNQPSNSKFVFGPSVWLRSLIRPPAGHAVVYIDWKQQEFGIAAALSGDAVMQAAYQSGDPYLTFGKQAGVIPADANKATHKNERELLKQCVLAVQYGMEAEALATRIGQPVIVARDLLRSHRQTYRKFWSWSDAAVDMAMLTGCLHTVFGWQLRIGDKSNPRSIRNFPMQANGAEMLRLACCLASERGIEICAPIHDAVLICASFDRLDAEIAATRNAMAEASRQVLAGFELGTDADVIRWPGRYSDPRGAIMWDRVLKLAMPNAERLSA
jgi:hypothetical protein